MSAGILVQQPGVQRWLILEVIDRTEGGTGLKAKLESIELDWRNEQVILKGFALFESGPSDEGGDSDFDEGSAGDGLDAHGAIMAWDEVSVKAWVWDEFGLNLGRGSLTGGIVDLGRLEDWIATFPASNPAKLTNKLPLGIRSIDITDLRCILPKGVGMTVRDGVGPGAAGVGAMGASDDRASRRAEAFIQSLRLHSIVVNDTTWRLEIAPVEATFEGIEITGKRLLIVGKDGLTEVVCEDLVFDGEYVVSGEAGWPMCATPGALSVEGLNGRAKVHWEAGGAVEISNLTLGEAISARAVLNLDCADPFAGLIPEIEVAGRFDPAHWKEAAEPWIATGKLRDWATSEVLESIDQSIASWSNEGGGPLLFNGDWSSETGLSILGEATEPVPLYIEAQVDTAFTKAETSWHARFDAAAIVGEGTVDFSERSVDFKGSIEGPVLYANWDFRVDFAEANRTRAQLGLRRLVVLKKGLPPTAFERLDLGTNWDRESGQVEFNWQSDLGNGKASATTDIDAWKHWAESMATRGQNLGDRGNVEALVEANFKRMAPLARLLGWPMDLADGTRFSCALSGENIRARIHAPEARWGEWSAQEVNVQADGPFLTELFVNASAGAVEVDDAVWADGIWIDVLADSVWTVDAMVEFTGGGECHTEFQVNKWTNRALGIDLIEAGGHWSKALAGWCSLQRSQ